MANSYDRKEFEQYAAQFGLENVTDAEWESLCQQDGKTPRFGMKTAAVRLGNTRAGTSANLKKQKSKEKDTIRAVFLGSEDLTTKKIDLESANGLRVLLATEDELGWTLESGATWGAVKVNGGDLCDFEVVRSETVTEDGRKFKNLNVGKATVVEPGFIKSAADLHKIGIEPMDAEDVRETMMWKMVAVKGTIQSIDHEPRWDGGMRDEDNPFSLYYNDTPCFQALLSGKGKTRVRLRVRPTKNSVPHLQVEDLDELCKLNDVYGLNDGMVSREVIGIGTLTRFTPGEPNWSDLACFALMEADLMPTISSGASQQTLVAPSEENDSSVSDAPKESKASTPAPTAKKSGNVSVIQKIKDAAAEAYDLVGKDVTVNVLIKDLGLIEDGIAKPQIVGKVIQNFLKEKDHDIPIEEIIGTA